MCNIFSRYAWELCMEPPLVQHKAITKNELRPFFKSTSDLWCSLISDSVNDLQSMLETATVQFNIPPVPMLFHLWITCLPLFPELGLLVSSVPSPKWILLFVLEINTTLHLTASFELRSSISYIRQCTSGWGGCRFQANHSPSSSSEAKGGLPHFHPLKEEAREQRESDLDLSSHSLSVLRKLREGEASCSSREIQQCWLASRYDSEHKLQKRA